MKLIVLPTATSAAWKRERTLARQGVVLGFESIPLSRLVDLCAQAAGLGPALGGPARLEILAGLVESSPFKGALGKSGLLKALLGLIDRLTFAGPDRGKTALALKSLDQPRLSNLSRVFLEYHRTLNEKSLLDPPGRAWLAVSGPAPGLNTEARIETLKGVNELEVRDIESFTPAQAGLLAALARRGRRVKIHVPFQPAASLFDPTDGPAANWQTFRLLEKLQKENTDFTVAGDQFTDRLPGSPGAELISLLARGPAAATEPVAGLERFSARGKYSELEAVGRRIRALLDKGANPANIGLAARSLSGLTGQMIEDIGRRFSIPLNFRRGHPLAETPPVATVLALLDMAALGPDRSGLIRLAESAYLNLGNGRCNGEVISVIIESGLLPGPNRDWRACLEIRLDRAGQADKPALREALARLAQLEDLIRPLASPGSLGRGLGLLRDLALGLALADDPVLGSRDRAGRDGFIQALDQAGQDLARAGLADKKVDAARLKAFLGSVLADQTAIWTAGSAAGVRVLRAEDVRGLALDQLFITGLVDGEWPSAMRSDPLLSDSDKINLNRALGQDLFTTRDSHRSRERLLLLMVLASAKGPVHLSRHTQDSSGKPKAASPLWSWLETCLGGHAPPETREGTHRPPLLSQVLSQGEMTGRLSLELSRADADRQTLDQARGAVAELVSRPKWAARLADIQLRADIEHQRAMFMLSPETEARERLSARPHVGRLTPEISLGLLKAKLNRDGAWNLPISGLDELAACPYRFLASRILEAGPERSVTPDPDPLEFGILVHAVLQRLMEHCVSKNHFPPTEAEVENILADQAGEWRNRVYKGHPILADRKIAQARFLAQRFLAWEDQQRDQGWRPLELEKRFKDLVVDLGPENNIRLTAQVDRIDLGPGSRLRVIDYKTGTNKTYYNRMIKEAGQNYFQLPVYMSALKAQDHDPDLITGGYYLAGLALHLNTEPLSSLNRTMEESLTRLISRIKEGSFEPAPLRAEECAGICVRLELCRYRKPISQGEE